jgi:hypothetical protein
LLAKPSPLNINLGSDRFSMFNKERDIRRAATSTRFAAATMLNPIAGTGSISIENSLAWAELFARDNCEPRSKNAL